MPQLMVSIVNHFAKAKPGHLIIDDTFMSKVFSKLLAGVYTMYNTAMCRSERGLSIVVICWSNGEITIPIKFDWLFHKDVVGEKKLNSLQKLQEIEL